LLYTLRGLEVMKYHLSINIIVSICVILSMFQSLSIQETNAQSNEIIDYVIIAPESFREALNPLMDHKTQQGISTKIVTLEEIENESYPQTIGRDSAENIKYFITFSHETWGTNYILLAGGKQQIPVRYANINISEGSLAYPYSFLSRLPFIDDNPLIPQFSTYISDLYYADLYFENGSFCSWDTNNNLKFSEKNETMQIDLVDITPDVAVGRFLCQTSDQIETIVEKIITYETTAYQQEWFNHLIVSGGDTHSLWRDLLIKPMIPAEYNAQIAWEGEYMGDVAAATLDDFQVHKIYATGLINDESVPISKETISNQINNGCGFLLLAGHGYPEAWGTHPPSLFGKIWLPGPVINPELYNSNDVQALSNQEKLPVAVISACSCGDFNETLSPFAWEFVQNPHGGAIASFACSTLGTLLPTTVSADTLNGKLALGVFDAYKNGVHRLGDIWKETISSYLSDEKAMELGDFAQVYWLNQFNLEEWILFGDPTLQVGGYPD